MLLGPQLMAAFLSPALFFGGAAAVAAPILIHLLARRRFKRIRWAAMDFLLDAERRNRRRIQMEEWILLALRCLAILLLALTIARPFLRPTSAAALFGGSARTERVFLLDDSLSTSFQTADGVVFDRTKDAVHRLLESIRKESPDDTATILRMSDPTTPVESGTYLDDSQIDALFARIDALAPTQRSMDPSFVVAGLAEVLQRSPEVTNAVVYIISDFQRTDWVETRAVRSGDADNDTEGGAGSANVMQPLTEWADQDRGLSVVLVNVDEDGAANTAIDDLQLRGGRLVAGTTGAVRVGVVNHSDQQRENFQIGVAVGNRGQSSQILRELPARQSSSVDVDVEFLRAGYEGVRVEIPSDALAADDVRYLAAEVASAVSVLIVNGEPSVDEYDDEVMYLATALRPEGDVFSGNDVVVVDEAGLENANLDEVHTVVLANVYRVSEPAIESLERFVRRGGGLLIFLGDQVDADLYNTALFRDGDGLLPSRLTEVRRAVDASHLVITDRLHPAMQGLSVAGDPLGIGQISFFKYFANEPFVGEEASADPEGDTVEALESSTLARGDARVIARFDDPDETPAIVERSFGAGKVLMVACSADKEWHHWPDHPTFVPVMMEFVRHVARGSDSGVAYAVGDTLELPIDPAVFEQDALVRTPSYPDERETGVSVVPARDGVGLAMQWEHTEVAGLYQFVLRRREGGQVIKMLAVNVDPRESDLTPSTEDELRKSLTGVPLTYIKGVEQLGALSNEGRTEFWRLCLIAAVAVLMIEQCLAWTWGRRR